MENVFWLKEPTRTPQRDERHRLVSAKWVMGLIAPSAVREACSMGTKPNEAHFPRKVPPSQREEACSMARGALPTPLARAHIFSGPGGTSPPRVCNR